MSDTSANRAIGRLIGAFPNRDWSDLAVTEFVRALVPEDPDVLDAAIDQLISTEEWPPTIAKILASCASIRIERRRNDMDRREWSSCPRQCDHGWEPRGEGVAPCSACRPEAYAKWDRGEFRTRVLPRADAAPIPDELRQLRDFLNPNRPKDAA